MAVVPSLRRRLQTSARQGRFQERTQRSAPETNSSASLVEDSIETTAYGYDALGREIAKTFILNQHRYTIRTRYDALGRITREAAIADLFDYIEVFYNRRRRHSTLGNKPPIQFLQDWISTQHKQNLAA